MRASLFVLVLALSSGFLSAASQRFSFALPEFEGRISLGVYDASGKLIRSLFVNADEADFEKGLNGLIADWDGRTSTDQQAPPGNYSVRGFLVGDSVQAEGIAFHFNDWIESDDSPRISWVEAVVPTGADSFLLYGARPAEAGLPALRDEVWRYEDSVGLAVGAIWLSRGDGFTKNPLAERPGDFCVSAGPAETLWVSSRQGTDIIVRQHAYEGGLLREMRVSGEGADSARLFTDKADLSFFLLTKLPAGRGQTLRGYRPLEASPAPSKGDETVSVDWEVFLDKTIVPCRQFGWVGGRLVADAGNASPPDRVKFSLPPNTLTAQASELELTAAGDSTGLWLQSVDGLKLLLLAEPNPWDRLVLVKEGDSLHVFAGDGVVVAEYLVSGFAHVAAINAGLIEIP